MKLKLFGLVLVLYLLVPGSLLAQGLFDGFSFPVTVTATGQTERVGAVMVSLRTGTTVAGTLVIDLSPYKITNPNAGSIQVTATGLTVGATTIDTDLSLVRIPVNAGASAGSIRVEGIRIAIAGTGATSVNAKLSWESSLNVLLSGTNLNVVNSVQSGLAAEPVTDRFVIFNNQLYDATSTISVREGYASAFSDATNFGQTVPTRVRIHLSDLPAGLRFTFPASVTSKDSAATLSTVGGGSVTFLLPDGGTTDVTYNFAGVSSSNDILERFDIPFTVAIVDTLGYSQPTIEVGLSPIGAAVPDATFPSTDIPRYAKDDIVVQEGTSRLITKVLYWTGINERNQNQVNVLNPSSRFANLTIEAFDTTGKAATSAPVKISLSANQSIVRSLADLFGSATGIASMRIQSTGPDVLATAVVSGNGTAESVEFVSRTLASFVVPVVNQGAQVTVFNPNSSQATGTLTLRTIEGLTVSTQQVTLGALASNRVTIASAFANPTSGYISGDFSVPVIADESFGDSSNLNLLAIQPPAGVAALYAQLSVVGNGFQTDINLINVSNDNITIKAQLYNSTGAAVGSAVLIIMPPHEQLTRNVTQIFPQTSPLGFIRFEMPQQYTGFFPYYPLVIGQAQIRSAQGGSTVIPFSEYPLSDQYILGSGTGANEFEGLTLINPGTVAAAVSLQALNGSGAVVGSASVTLNPGQVVSQLVTEFFTGGLAPQSVIRVTSSSPLFVSAVTGSTSLDTLRSLPALK
jgi:uncharacterized protein DUF5719